MARLAALAILAAVLGSTASAFRVVPAMADRRAFVSVGLAVPAFLLSGPRRANAITGGEADRIRTGYKNLNYLLENWDKETTKCNKAGGCVRTPDNIRFYLGQRSTSDPLFNIEKVFLRAGEDVEGPDGELLEDAINQWSRHCEQASVMAYTSSWGEANPGGGELQINRFAKKAQDEVIQAKDALATIMKILAIEA